MMTEKVQNSGGEEISRQGLLGRIVGRVLGAKFHRETWRGRLDLEIAEIKNRSTEELSDREKILLFADKEGWPIQRASGFGMYPVGDSGKIIDRPSSPAPIVAEGASVVDAARGLQGRREGRIPLMGRVEHPEAKSSE